MSKIKPIFLLSLPRSGSTLVQRVIGAHPEVSTVSEPWIQLPLTTILRDNHIFTDYSHAGSRKAITDLVKNLPRGEEDIYSALKNASYELYSKLSKNNTIYFLDKTPRYHLIGDLLLKIFPEAKFIILWRNPLAIASSMIETWGNNKWILYRYKIDLYNGLENLLKLKKLSNNIININYESLVNENNELIWKKLFKYLDLDFNPKYLETFSKVKLLGSMGDPFRDKYNLINDESKKWTLTYDNVLRVYWAKKYLNWIGKKNLTEINYDYESLLDVIPNSKFSKNLPMDIVALGISKLKPWIEPYIFKTKLRTDKSGNLLNHS